MGREGLTNFVRQFPILNFNVILYFVIKVQFVIKKKNSVHWLKIRIRWDNQNVFENGNRSGAD